MSCRQSAVDILKVMPYLVLFCNWRLAGVFAVGCTLATAVAAASLQEQQQRP